MDNDARSTPLCSCSRVMLFRDYGKWRLPGCLQLHYFFRVCSDHCASMKLSTIPAAYVHVEVPKEVDSQTTCGKAAGARAKRRSRARKEASAQEVQGHYRQFAEAGHLEWKTWIDNQVFDLVHLRNVQPKNCVTRRWVLTSRATSKATSSGRRPEWVLRGFQDKQKDQFSCIHNTCISDELQDGSQQKLGSVPH